MGERVALWGALLNSTLGTELCVHWGCQSVEVRGGGSLGVCHGPEGEAIAHQAWTRGPVASNSIPSGPTVSFEVRITPGVRGGRKAWGRGGGEEEWPLRCRRLRV